MLSLSYKKFFVKKFFDKIPFYAIDNYRIIVKYSKKFLKMISQTLNQKKNGKTSYNYVRNSLALR